MEKPTMFAIFTCISDKFRKTQDEIPSFDYQTSTDRLLKYTFLLVVPWRCQVFDIPGALDFLKAVGFQEVAGEALESRKQKIQIVEMLMGDRTYPPGN